MNKSIEGIIAEILKSMVRETSYPNIQEFYNEFDKNLKLALNIPVVSNCADLKPPHFKQKKMTEKAEKAKHLQTIGYSIREIMRIMNYKSPRSVQVLLKK